MLSEQRWDQSLNPRTPSHLPEPVLPSGPLPSMGPSPSPAPTSDNLNSSFCLVTLLFTVRCCHVCPLSQICISQAFCPGLPNCFLSGSIHFPHAHLFSKILRDVISPHHFLLPFPPLKCDSSDGCVMDMVPDQGVRLLCCAAGERCGSTLVEEANGDPVMLEGRGHCLGTQPSTQVLSILGKGVNRRRRHKGRQRN